MAFLNDDAAIDNFRKIGADSTAQFERPGMPDNPTEHASSENLTVAADEDDDPDEEEDDLDEEDEELDDEDIDDDDDLEDDDEEDEDEEDEEK